MAPGAISPELALVDPSLAEEARALLPGPHSFVEIPASPPHRPDEHEQFRTLATAALNVDRAVGLERPAERSWRLLGAVAASTILVVLLLDVRVELGRTPAAAESVRSMQSATSVPRAPATSSPSRPAISRESSMRRFAWAPVTGADGYRVELFRSNDRVFSAATERPQLMIPARWTYGGRPHSLTPGEYQWYVWAIVAGRRAASAIVQAKLTVP